MISMTDLKAMVASMVTAGLDAKIVLRADGEPYVVVRIGDSFHAFREIEAKQAAKNCGAIVSGRHSNEIWKSDLW